MQEDQLVTPGVRDWIKRLEITLNKVATADQSFLQHSAEAPHSAVKMLNLLARLGNAGDVQEGIDREVGGRVDELLEGVIEGYDQNPEVFDEVVSELNPLIDRQTRAYRGNIERTVRASEGQQKLARARRAVLDEMEEVIGDQDTPELLIELLSPGWRNLLVHTHLRNGADSSEWRDALAVIEQVKDHLNGTADPEDAGYVEPDQVLKRIVKGLNDISYDPAKRTPLVMKLSSAMVGDASGDKTPSETVHTPKEEVISALSLIHI